MEMGSSSSLPMGVRVYSTIGGTTGYTFRLMIPFCSSLRKVWASIFFEMPPISLRTGCFCNPGAGEIAMGVSRVELDVCFTRPGHEKRLSQDDFRLCFDGKSTGAVRISVGMVTNFNDVQAFLQFAKGLLN